MAYIGLDIGYGFTKMIYAWQDTDTLVANQQKFPTAIARVSSEIVSTGYNEIDVVEFNGKHYIVGEPAVHAKHNIGTRDVNFMKNYGQLFIYETMRLVTGGQDGNTIAVGLPPADYKNHREELACKLKQFTINGEVINNNISVLPQAAVALVEWIQQHGSRNDIILADIGFNTLDVVPMHNGKALPGESATINSGGISQIADELSSVLRVQYGLQLNLHETINAIEDGYVINYGRKVNILTEIQAAVSGYIEWIYGQLQDQWGDRLRKSHHLVMIGGGCYILQKHIPEKYKDMTQILRQPEYANARGYFRVLAHNAGKQPDFKISTIAA